MSNIKPGSIIATSLLCCSFQSCWCCSVIVSEGHSYQITGYPSRAVLTMGLLQTYKNLVLNYIVHLDWCCSEVIAIQKRLSVWTPSLCKVYDHTFFIEYKKSLIASLLLFSSTKWDLKWLVSVALILACPQSINPQFLTKMSTWAATSVSNVFRAQAQYLSKTGFGIDVCCRSWCFLLHEPMSKCI